MNKRFLIPALAWSLLALSFAGCTDDNMSGSDPAGRYGIRFRHHG